MESKENLILKAMKKEAKPLRPGDIAAAAKLDKDEVTKLLKKLKDDGKINSPKKCFYEIAN